MNKADNELEKLFRYRLIQVSYTIGLILSLLFILLLAIITCPEEHLNIEKSKVTCSDGKIYTFSAAGMKNPWNYYSRYFWQSYTPKLLDDDKQQLEMQCVGSFLALAFSGEYNKRDLKKLSDSELLAFILAKLEATAELKRRGASVSTSLSDADLEDKIAENKKELAARSVKNFSFAYDSPQGVWFWFISLLFLLPTCLYACLNILRETLIYLFIGRKFTWQWLKFYKRLAS